MTLKCGKCPKTFTCTNHDVGIAFRQVYDSLNQHFHAAHPKTSARVDSDIEQLLIMVEIYSRVIEFADLGQLPENVENHLDSVGCLIASQLGFDIEEDEDNEESEGNEDNVVTKLEPVLEDSVSNKSTE